MAFIKLTSHADREFGGEFHIDAEKIEAVQPLIEMDRNGNRSVHGALVFTSGADGCYRVSESAEEVLAAICIKRAKVDA